MTRSSRLNDRPDSVMLGELAMAAGLAGHSVTLCYQGFPAHVTCELWKHHAATLDASTLLHVNGQADIKELRKRLGELRLVLVHAPRLCRATAWAIQVAADAESAIRPAVFCHSAGLELEECPGPALVVRGDGDESASAERWFESRQPANRCLSAAQPTGELPQLAQLGEVDLHGIQQRQVLEALLHGACLLRANGQLNAASLITNEDYQLARTLLQSRVVAGPGETVDLIAVDMVARANIYMCVKYGPDVSDANPFSTLTDSDERSSSASRRELITRREVADLGNTYSQTVRHLITYLKTQPDGFDHFAKIGLIRKLTNRDKFLRASAKSLSILLRGWSVKQVRTHFDRLRQAGLITAERDRGNGPWRYELPDELRGKSAAFRGLPNTLNM